MSDEPFAVYADDLDLRAYDFWPDDIPSGLYGAERRDTIQPLLDRAGGVLINAESALPSRTFALRGTLICSSRAAARARWDTLHDLFAGTVELRTALAPDRVLRVRAQHMTDSPQGLAGIGWPVSIDLTAPDPLWYDRVPTLYALPAGVSVPLAPGSAPSGIGLVLYGPATDPVVDLLEPGGGGTGQQMVFTASIADGAAVEIDAIAQEIVTMAADRTRTSTPGLLTDGNYLVLDPLFGTGDAAGYPALRVTGCAGMAILRRAWR